MVKILSTTDWHIGNNFHGYDRHEEHEHFLKWLTGVVEEKSPDALLVSGDVFDNSNPSAASQELFYSFLDSLTGRFPELQVVIIAGNHDSAARLEAPRAMLQRHNVFIRGVVKKNSDGTPCYDDLIIPVVSADSNERALVLAVPYLRDGDFPRGMAYSEGVNYFISSLVEKADSCASSVSCDGKTSMILMAHLYASGSEIAENSSERIVVGGAEQVDMAMLDFRVSLALIGHLHRRQRLGGRDDRIYPGSALPMSFSEKSYKHGAVYVELENGRLVDVPQYIDYSLQHPLISVPEKPLPLDEVLKCLSDLPDAQLQEAGNEPYIEVQVFLDSPVVGINKKIEDALSGKAVRLCRTVISYPSVSLGGGNEGMVTIEDLLNRNPIEVIKRGYFNKYHCEMREELVALANLAIEEARKEN